eukprot:TRINITY_DN82834_c0_g1_i1.p1 TRINITY_DN82834_c0_g1~~TRINITY_DN82834_c0_g1_i1.p1  ORF type:complete len:390 (-),score=57.79 TRINITY_DN82834_c0_g1_i1:37-1206(-)
MATASRDGSVFQPAMGTTRQHLSGGYAVAASSPRVEYPRSVQGAVRYAPASFVSAPLQYGTSATSSRPRYETQRTMPITNGAPAVSPPAPLPMSLPVSPRASLKRMPLMATSSQPYPAYGRVMSDTAASASRPSSVQVVQRTRFATVDTGEVAALACSVPLNPVNIVTRPVPQQCLVRSAQPVAAKPAVTIDSAVHTPRKNASKAPKSVNWGQRFSITNTPSLSGKDKPHARRISEVEGAKQQEAAERWREERRLCGLDDEEEDVAEDNDMPARGRGRSTSEAFGEDGLNYESSDDETMSPPVRGRARSHADVDLEQELQEDDPTVLLGRGRAGTVDEFSTTDRDRTTSIDATQLDSSIASEAGGRQRLTQSGGGYTEYLEQAPHPSNQ